MRFKEYLFVIERICRSTALPLSVDLEAGYGVSADEIVRNILRLSEIGVAGINLEDSVVVAGERSIVDKNRVADMLNKICIALEASNTEIFINVRSDVFLLGVANPTGEAIERIKAYEETGAHGLFLPCITRMEDIKAIVASAKLPVNVMCMPGLPDFESLKKAGVKRIGIGNFLNKAVYQNLESQVNRILNDGSFYHLFQPSTESRSQG